MASGEERPPSFEPRETLGRRLGRGEIASVLVLIVVLTETTECLRGLRSSDEESPSVPLVPPSLSVSSSSTPEPRALVVGEAEMSVETEVL